MDIQLRFISLIPKSEIKLFFSIKSFQSRFVNIICNIDIVALKTSELKNLSAIAHISLWQKKSFVMSDAFLFLVLQRKRYGKYMEMISTKLQKKLICQKEKEKKRIYKNRSQFCMHQMRFHPVSIQDESDLPND